ncbi:MAG: c-type cytochrome [Elusimicrobia bacterium]|nr:c-type cytochrome [Elusimicrobiota bacterium]
MTAAVKNWAWRAGGPGLLALAVCACGPKSLFLEQRGQAAYAAYNCRQCHRIGAAGGAVGPDLTYVGFRKSAEFMDRWLQDPSAWQKDAVMPNFHFNEPTRKALAAYLASLRGQLDRQDGPPWDTKDLKADPIRRGRAIYGRTGCATCHGREGRGGYFNNNVAGGLIPALTRVAEGYDKKELIQKIAKGVRQPAKADPAGPDPLLAMPAWGEILRPDEIEAVADYLLSIKPETAPEENW